MDQEIPKVPKRFIQNRLVINMKEGEIGFISHMMNLQLDEKEQLWVFKYATVDSEIETKNPSPGEKIDPWDNFLTTQKNIKIEKVNNGYRLYLHEHFDFLRDRRFECSSFSDCSADQRKNCVCKKEIGRSLLKIRRFDTIDGKEGFLPITHFDQPKKDVNDPQFLQTLTSETLKSLDLKDLQILLTNSIDDENYPIAALIRNEMNRRK